MKYQHREVEQKWQNLWEKNSTFLTPEDQQKPKYYILDMFPYPSGAGLHVGHPEGYTATDIVARYKRMRGFNVLHPMGWDAFGLPAERYAMQTGIHPSVTTEKNIANFKRQLKSIGFSYDWSREINTTDKGYYKWTQWIFLKIYNSWYDEDTKKARPIEDLPVPSELQGDENRNDRENYINSKRLAYIAEIPVNWCEQLGTVLANEEVDEWVSKGYTVERRPMRQWMLRITAYAERLLDDLKHVEWPSGTLELQKNWIGRSTGAQVDFALEDKDSVLTIFTTRPDTLFGVTYMVLAPEHPLVGQVTTTDKKSEVEEYVKAASLKSEMDRQLDAEKGKKTGVFTGGYAIHPFTGEKIPLWISDYVLMSYGTGAIMAVPAHDQRDFEFARSFGLQIKPVITPDGSPARDSELMEEAFTETGVNVDSEFLNGLKTPDAIKRMIDELVTKKIGYARVNYRLRDWLFSRQRYWGEPIPVSFDQQGYHHPATELPLELPPSEEFKPAGTGESPLANLTEWVNFTSPEGQSLRRETNTMPQWAGSSWYYIRFADPANSDAMIDPDKERYWLGETGVDLYVGGAEHAVLHLLYARFWHKVLFDYGYVSHCEPFKKLVHQGLILGEDGSKMSKSRGNVVNPDEVVAEYGADAFRLFEMFMGPLEQMKPWSSKGIEGVFRFLMRVWRLYVDDNGEIDPDLFSGEDDARAIRSLHQTIKKITADIESLSFNTAISQMMIFINQAYQSRGENKGIGGKKTLETFVQLLYPFAPHIAEELWEKLGNSDGLTWQSWPGYDEGLAKENEIEVVFQINGKVRSKAQASADIGEDELKALALADEVVVKQIAGKEIRKVIVVKNRLVNIVI